MTAILENLATIGQDALYDIYEDDHEIDVQLDDFGGFDEEWNEIERPYEDEEAVEAFLEWLEEAADYHEDDGCGMYEFYHFGEWTVQLGYTSFDI